MDRLHMLDQGIAIAIDSIRANKVRSGLTILGVAIGVGVVMMMSAMMMMMSRSWWASRPPALITLG